MVGDGGGAGGGDKERGTNEEIKENSRERCFLCLLNFGDFGGALGISCELTALLQILVEVAYSKLPRRDSCSVHVLTSSRTP